MQSRIDAIISAHRRFAAAAARARREFTGARALRADLRRARERELAAEQSRAFDDFTREVETHLEALRVEVRDMRPANRLVRAMMEKAEYRERARAAADMLARAPLSMLRDMAATASATQDVGTLAGVRQVFDARADTLDQEDPDVRAVHIALQAWALPAYEEARSELLRAQALAARAQLAGPWQDATAALFANPARYASAMRAAAFVEAEALLAQRFTVRDVERLLSEVPPPSETTRSPDDDFAPGEAAGALIGATMTGLPSLDAFRGGDASA